MSNNIAFEGNPENIQRFLLQHEFQHHYRQFDAKTVSHDAAPIATRTPIWLVIAINEFLDQFNVQEFIKRYKENHPEEINVNAFLKYLLTTNTFANFAGYHLEKELLSDNPQDVWPNCVFDKRRNYFILHNMETIGALSKPFCHSIVNYELTPKHKPFKTKTNSS